MDLNKSELPPKRKNQCWLMLSLLFACLAGRLLATEAKTIVFFGDSLTAGYGVDPDDAYPALIQKKIDATGLQWRVVNAGLSGETTAGGLRRLEWILRQHVDIFVIELGGNDGLRGIPTETSHANLQQMIDRLRQKYPDIKIILAGMQLPTNLGPDYTKKFAAIYPALAQENSIALIPFLLERVGGIPSLNQADGIHPTPRGHEIVAETVWATMNPML